MKSLIKLHQKTKSKTNYLLGITIQILFTLVFLITSLANAQSAEEKEVAIAVDNLRKGMLDGDKTLLEAAAAPELSYGHSSGTIEDKAAFVEAIASGKSDFTKIELTKQSIKIIGGIALVRHELHGENSGTPVNIGVLLVWQKQKNQWRLIARQAFKLV